MSQIPRQLRELAARPLITFMQTGGEWSVHIRNTDEYQSAAALQTVLALDSDMSADEVAEVFEEIFDDLQGYQQRML